MVDQNGSKFECLQKIIKKIAFYPNRKIFSQKFIRWNAELDKRKKFFDIMGTLNKKSYADNFELTTTDIIIDKNIIFFFSSLNIYTIHTNALCTEKSSQPLKALLHVICIYVKHERPCLTTLL